MQQPFKVLLGTLVGLVVGGGAGWYLGLQQDSQLPAAADAADAARGAAPGATPAAKRVADPVPVTRYGFEADRPIGWICGDYEYAQACKGVAHSSELYKEGASALRFDLDLSGTSARRSSGEIWVDVNLVAPTGHEGPLGLAGRTLVAWVYATPGSLGDKDRPNGFQLFVKDGNWQARYGAWQDVQEGQWVQLSFPVPAAEAGFDPARINAIGLKMAAGSGATARFQGPVFVDAVGWL